MVIPRGRQVSLPCATSNLVKLSFAQDAPTSSEYRLSDNHQRALDIPTNTFCAVSIHHFLHVMLTLSREAVFSETGHGLTSAVIKQLQVEETLLPHRMGARDLTWMQMGVKCEWIIYVFILFVERSIRIRLVQRIINVL